MRPGHFLFFTFCLTVWGTNEIMIGTNKYKRPAVLIFIFNKVERQVHIGTASNIFLASTNQGSTIDFIIFTLIFESNNYDRYKQVQTKYKRPAVLIFIFDKIERQVHIGVCCPSFILIMYDISMFKLSL